MTPADPLAAAVADFRAKWAEFCAVEDEDLHKYPEPQPWRIAWNALADAPTATTREGAIAALQFILDDTQPDGPGEIDVEHRAVLEAVKRYLEAG